VDETSPSTSPSHLARALALLAIPLLIGCGRIPESQPETHAAGQSATKVQAKPELRRTTQSEVRWPSAATLDRAALAALSEEARAAAERSPVPVLAPRLAAVAGAAKVIASEHWYSLSAREDGLTVSLMGTRIAHEHSSIQPVRGKVDLRGQKGFVTQNEGIWSAAWIENGVAYSLDLECDDPAEARCQDDALLRVLVEDLAYVGGEEAATR